MNRWPRPVRERIHACAGPARMVFIGASTGGPEAIRVVLAALPADMPPILIAQHMPASFTGAFSRGLDRVCAMRVKEAEQGERIEAGTAYLAPGDAHLALRRAGAGHVCELLGSAPVNGHRPSVDVLFESAARSLGPAAVGVLLTGMGKDGARGLLAMNRAGAWTLAQDEASCIVYGMPREAVALGAASQQVALGLVAAQVQRALGRAGPGGRGGDCAAQH